MGPEHYRSDVLSSETLWYENIVRDKPPGKNNESEMICSSLEKIFI